MKLIVVIFLMLVSLNPISRHQTETPPPTEFEWRISTPENEGLDQAGFDQLEADWIPQFRSITGVVVVYNDAIIYEDYHLRQTADSLMSVFSVSKSIGSILTGIALDEGFIADVDEPISTFFPNIYSDIDDPNTQLITVENVLTMSTGLRSGWNLEGSPINAYRGNLFAMALNLPQTGEPGTTATYNTIVSNLLSGILAEAVGEDLEDYTERVLFEPLGIDNWAWYRDDTNFPTLGAGIELRTRDMARIGRLMLRGGDWEGEQIVSQEWIERSTQPHYEITTWTNETHGYGYLWWITQDTDYDSFLALGYGGQFIYVVPELDLVVAISSQCCVDPTIGWNTRKLVDDYLIPMIETALDDA